MADRRAPTSILRPRAAVPGYTPRQVARAYNAPMDLFDGTGVTIGVVELGGACNAADLKQYAQRLGVKLADVEVVPVDGAKPTSDGPDGADGEVMLDVEVIAAVAPGAKQRVYFAPNTDRGFFDAIVRATTECDFVSISWGGPESAWDSAAMDAYEQMLADARARGVGVFVASGDTGSRDGTRANVVDFPASSPSVIGCGGTRLQIGPNGERVSEVTWDDSDTQSATGGGVSSHFPGRMVPDVAGNASPNTGYQVIVDGQLGVIGGTSAVAPLYAACAALLRQAYGKPYDFLNTVLTNPDVCYDVTVGDNGGYKAGPGRDQTTGFGVVDFGRMLTILTSGTQVPAPGGNEPPAPTPEPGPHAPPMAEYEDMRAAYFTAKPHPYSKPKAAAALATEGAFIDAFDIYLGR